MLHRWKASGQAALPPEMPPEREADVDPSARDAPHRPVRVEGAVAGVQNGLIAGWAWDGQRPYEPLDIELYVGDFLVGRGKADQFDIELARACRGNGMHRFELPLERIPKVSPPFQIRTVVAGTKTELLPAISVATLAEAESLLSGSEYLGQITGIVDGVIQGWALNRRNPHEYPVLTLRDGSREIAVQPALEQATATVETGVAASVFRFQFPVPASALDGQMHAFSVVAGPAGIALGGSPVLFGPADSVSIVRTLIGITERLDRFERRIESLRTEPDFSQLERRLAAGVIEPLDMLMGVHRDSIEREMAVMRRQLVGLARRIPELDSDVIAADVSEPAIEDVPVPAESAFSVIERSAPLVRYDLAVRTPLARPTRALTWLNNAGGVSLGGSGVLELDGIAVDDVSLVLRGKGAGDAAEFGALLLKFNGRPMSGRFDVASNGDWSFSGQTLESTGEKPAASGLGIEYLTDIQRPTGRLILCEILVFAPSRAPMRVEQQPMRATIVNLGREGSGKGWHAPEAGGRGGVCWMGESGEISLNLESASSYNIRIPEIRPLKADIMSKLQVDIDGSPAVTEIVQKRGDSAIYDLRGKCHTRNGGANNQILRICFPKDCVKSPLELGLNQDGRPLTIALRCIIVSADQA